MNTDLEISILSSLGTILRQKFIDIPNLMLLKNLNASPMNIKNGG